MKRLGWILVFSAAVALPGCDYRVDADGMYIHAKKDLGGGSVEYAIHGDGSIFKPGDGMEFYVRSKDNSPQVMDKVKIVKIEEEKK